MKGAKGQGNPNWKGGRTVTATGYVLLRLPDHPAADVRGYVYEHRVVLEQTLGRPLRTGERVRHKDLDPGNNAPENLRLVSPLDLAEMTSCACGCGTEMTLLDKGRRPRRYVSGHNGVRGVRPGARPRWETGVGIPLHRRAALVEAFDGQCAYGCGRTFTCWDHVIPWAVGGSFRHAGNAVPACTPCNQAKGAHDGVEGTWRWIERGIRSDQSDAWLDQIALGLDWGALDLPVDDLRQTELEAAA